MIHGGCWQSQYDLSYMGHLGAALTEIGIATLNVEYRRLGEGDGGWPGTFADVARAADHVRTLAERHPLDLRHVIAVGHSAGGQLALWLATRPRLRKDDPLYTLEPLPLRGVVALAGITDLRRRGTACDADVARLLGGSESESTPLADRLSPIALLPSGVRSVLVHGERDRLVPLAMATDYVDAAKAHGDDARLVVIADAGHFDVVDPTSFTWPATREAVRAVLLDQ
jgi:acetyl esterase/lipase